MPLNLSFFSNYISWSSKRFYISPRTLLNPDCKVSHSFFQIFNGYSTKTFMFANIKHLAECYKTDLLQLPVNLFKYQK